MALFSQYNALTYPARPFHSVLGKFEKKTFLSKTRGHLYNHPHSLTSLLTLHTLVLGPVTNLKHGSDLPCWFCQLQVKVTNLNKIMRVLKIHSRIIANFERKLNIYIGNFQLRFIVLPPYPCTWQTDGVPFREMECQTMNGGKTMKIY